MTSAKKKFRFYILTTASDRFLEYESCLAKDNANFHALQNLFSRRWSNIKYSDAVVVINTFDLEYQNLVVEWCKEKGIEHHVTECYGTAGKGKNELLKIFLNSDDDYCVQIDGDDVLTPYGVKVYKDLVNDNPPDSMIIYHQWSQTVNVYGQRIFHRIMDNPNAPMNYEKNYNRLKFNIKYYVTSNPKGYARAVEKLGGIDATTKLFTDYTHEVHEFSREYNEIYTNSKDGKSMVDAHCRPVWYSKKAAQYKFDEEMLIGEDTLQYLRLKTLHFKGKINMKRLKEVPCTYVYNNINGGMVAKSSINMTFLEWMKVYQEKTARDIRDNIIQKHPNLPEYFPPLYENINDYNITTDFNIDDIDIESITDKNIKEIYLNIKSCDTIRKETKEKINKIGSRATNQLRKLVQSLGKDIAGAYVHPPFKNILAAHPPGRQEYYLKRIIE